ncbi:hypothetical protein D1609_14485 [Leptospira borgpetersenii serovar Hardjo-bovis]|nr:hypothetical protein B9T54_14365 [Leptospira borgpetersenii serovar Hardjo-bovis]AYR09469.1 hypothetical protein D1609_14485 [Leptospira borgpetersenii serovar Hardjo-bovis]
MLPRCRFSLRIKLNSCLVILDIPVSIFEKPRSLQFFLREFYEEGTSIELFPAILLILPDKRLCSVSDG